jgi:hypothetical protein
LPPVRSPSIAVSDPNGPPRLVSYLPVKITPVPIASDLQTTLNDIAANDQEFWPDAWDEISGGSQDLWMKKSWKFVPRQPTASGDTVIIGGVVEYKIELGFGRGRWPRAGCEGRSSVDISMKISISASWSVDTPMMVSTTPIVRCRVTAANRDISHRVNNIVSDRVRALSGSIAEQVRQKVTVAGQIRTLWSALQQPRDTGRSGRLLLRPVAIIGPPVDVTIQSGVSVTLSVAALPILVLPPFSPVAARPLPVRLTGDARESTLDIVVDEPVAMSRIADPLKQSVSGPYVVGSKTVAVSEATFSVSANTGILKLTMTGDVSGQVFLTGPMKFEYTSGLFSFDRLLFSPETVDAIRLCRCDWLQSSDFADQIRGRATVVLPKTAVDLVPAITQALTVPEAPGQPFSATIQRTTNISVFGVSPDHRLIGASPFILSDVLIFRNAVHGVAELRAP